MNLDSPSQNTDNSVSATLFENTPFASIIHVDTFKELLVPSKIILIDINGTLIHDNSLTIESIITGKDEYIDFNQDVYTRFIETVGKLHEKGFKLGLCTDSPNIPLRHLSAFLHLDDLSIAENGNLIQVENRIYQVRTLNAIENFRRSIVKIAMDNGFINLGYDIYGPEFGGRIFNFEDDNNLNKWAFGAGRTTSLTVFGPREFIELINNQICDGNDYSKCSEPDFNFFALHAGANYKINKASTLAMFTEQTVYMIGNTVSDWVPKESGVNCSFVKDNRGISKDDLNDAFHISSSPLILGVIEILDQISIRH